MSLRRIAIASLASYTSQNPSGFPMFSFFLFRNSFTLVEKDISVECNDLWKDCSSRQRINKMIDGILKYCLQACRVAEEEEQLYVCISYT